MNPVMIDWLSVVLGPIGCILLVVALVKTRSATKAGAPVPPWAKVAQGVGIALVLVLALLHLIGTD
ncbi:hypothetical protein SAMN04489732_113208 [Amycolatopsis saalfeldensis]|uniref:Uncharacterized protein n=2 Tax=Amycolatopsis saalfeldensis TaxID=394193 RepID=A0A1H8YED2_9PSEU|nr:hypothetical protein SAMN04489732_113208 [Amycolatopsis saalfeldensis]